MLFENVTRVSFFKTTVYIGYEMVYCAADYLLQYCKPNKIFESQ